MFRNRHLAGLSLAVLIATGTAAPARAQTAEAEALGLQMAHILFTAVNFDAAILKGVKESMGEGVGVKDRPEWNAYLSEAITEEAQHDLPAFEALMGHAFAKTLSLDELKAGVIMMNDRGIQSSIRAGAQGKPDPGIAPGRDAQRAAGTLAGRAFLNRLEHLDRIMDPLQADMAAELMPGAFRRVADKIEAGEAKRKAGAAP